MKLNQNEIMKYGKQGLHIVQTGKRVYGAVKCLPFFRKRAQRAVWKKEEKQARRQEKRMKRRTRDRGNMHRLKYVGQLFLALQRRYF